VILHITSRTAWDNARSLGWYLHGSLETEGFIHCSTEEQVVQVANAFYRGQKDLVLLVIDEARLASRLSWEAPAGPPAPGISGSDLFPHVHGAINLAAVICVADLAIDADGTFTFTRLHAAVRVTRELDRIRHTYDAVAERYVVEFADELGGKPLDRALLDGFAALVVESGPRGVVADVGCGPGHVTSYLADRGLAMCGVDLSPAMIAAARRRNPAIDFAVGSMTALDAPDGAWAGAVVLYAIIHLSVPLRVLAFRELARVIRPGGWLLCSFHVSSAHHSPGDVGHLDSWWEQSVDLDGHFLDPTEVTDALADAGFAVRARLDREPIADAEYPSRRTYLIARLR
jgi:uncharacterized protein (DUF952 family)/SAM-dependent methyltransferase